MRLLVSKLCPSGGLSLSPVEMVCDLWSQDVPVFRSRSHSSNKHLAASNPTSAPANHAEGHLKDTPAVMEPLKSTTHVCAGCAEVHPCHALCLAL